jgi:hypothetical protein
MAARSIDLTTTTTNGVEHMKTKRNTNGDLVSLINDPVEAVIAKATTIADRGALAFVVELVTKTKAAARPGLWRHFERTIGKSVRYLIAELRIAFEEVERSALDPKSTAFDAKKYGQEQQRLTAGRNAGTVDGDHHA